MEVYQQQKASTSICIISKRERGGWFLKGPKQRYLGLYDMMFELCYKM